MLKFSICITCILLLATGALWADDISHPFSSFMQGEMINTVDSSNGMSFREMPEPESFELFEAKLDHKKLDVYFREFMTKFGKSYKSADELNSRKAIFRDSLMNVYRHNLKALDGRSTYTQHINGFADMELVELVGRGGGGGDQPPANHSHTPPDDTVEPITNTSATVVRQKRDQGWIYDWRSVNVVGPVQNQLSCGACVYFAAAALIETYWARTGHGVTPLSTQQLNDCARDDPNGNHGCEEGGGTFVPTFNYIQRKGLTSWQNYPYIAKDANCDHGKESQRVASISSWTPVRPAGNEEVLRLAIQDHGPAAVALHVNDAFQRYRQGIFDDPCPGGRNHAVLAVGYGHDGGSNKDYWILKNQWGTGWGEQGFMNFRRNNNDQCLISTDAVIIQ
ncbi:procathepsin L-like [Oppia nitens]|uniref:procathepsin L-like n=1 Tax=Oppia nitens TaxID=1686743 RepID=UPI0023DB4AA4|nr:procathepsin L-like [Oppia nitens]